MPSSRSSDGGLDKSSTAAMMRKLDGIRESARPIEAVLDIASFRAIIRFGLCTTQEGTRIVSPSG